MTVGLPGAGIGGIFYLVSALAMPVHAAFEALLARAGVIERSSRGRTPWLLVWRQFAIALGILAGLWVAGWLLTELIRSSPAALRALNLTGRRVPEVLRASAFVFSLATLLTVMGSVHVARVAISPRSPLRLRSGSRRRWLFPPSIVLMLALSPSPVSAQDGGPPGDAAAAPAIEVGVDGSSDSDDNTSLRVRAAADAAVTPRVRLRASVARRTYSGDSDLGVDEALLGFSARPSATLRVSGEAGAMKPRNTVAESDAIGAGNLRARWRQPGGRGLVDLRANRMLLDVVPLLVENRVVRSEVNGRVDVPIAGPILVRGSGRAARYTAPGHENTRAGLLGALVAAVAPAAEVSAAFQRISFDRPSGVGYFAPRNAQVAELGSYAEFESASGLLFALDVGAGAQRITEFGESASDWKPAFRLYSLLTVPLRPASELRVELDSYDSRLAGDAATAESWRYASLSAGVRLALR